MLFLISPECKESFLCTLSFLTPYSISPIYRPVITFLLPFFIAPSVVLVSEIFPCKGTTVARSSSTAPLIGSRIERQPSTNRRWLFSPLLVVPVGLGIPLNPRSCFPCLSVLFPLSDLHVKSIPTRKSKGFQQRERKQGLTD